MRVRERGHKGGEIKQAEQAKISHHPTGIQGAAAEQQKRMEQAKRVGAAKQEHRHIPSLEITLPHKGIPHTTRVHHKTIHFFIFLCSPLHDLHAIQRLGEMGIHHPKPGTDLVGDRRESF